MKREMKRKGFTLVELLIVIVVIGILSAMMMLSSTEAVSSARANNIISNLRNLKTAVLSWYMDNLDRVAITTGNDGKITKVQITDKEGKNPQNLTVFVNSEDGNKEILKYLNNGDAVTLKGGTEGSYGDGVYFIKDTKYKNWYICTKVPDANVRNKLASRAKNAGLVGKAAPTGDENITTPYSDAQYVGTLVLTLGD